MKYFFRKGLDGTLRPHGDDSVEMLKKIKLNELVRVEVSRPRNVQQHNFYWALCRLVAMNHETLTNERMVDQAIKIRAGHVDLVRIGDDIVKIPRSIAFDSMPQDEFDKYLAAAKDVVVADLLPGVGLRELQEEILRMAA